MDQRYLPYEADVFNASFLRLNGVTTDTWPVANRTLKYGLAPKFDVEVNVSALEIICTHDTSGRDKTIAGVSEFCLRLKYEFMDV